jgi:hypothetical protein
LAKGIGIKLKLLLNPMTTKQRTRLIKIFVILAIGGMLLGSIASAMLLFLA